MSKIEFITKFTAEDLKMHAYKIQLTQKLKSADHGKSSRFAQWVLARQAKDENFRKRIIFSDEVHFHLSGYVNKQNCRIWGDENPRVTVETRDASRTPMNAFFIVTRVWVEIWPI